MFSHGMLNKLAYIREVRDGVIIIKGIRIKAEFFEDGGELSMFELGGEKCWIRGTGQ